MSQKLDMATIAGLSGPAIIAAWERVLGTPAPNVPPSMLARHMTWQMQADELGGLDKRIERHLNRLCNASADVRQVPGLPQAHAAGTVYLREWGGQLHRVELLPDRRYSYAGKEWKSLSVIARHITGAHWSGPRFFGTAPEQEFRVVDHVLVHRRAARDEHGHADALPAAGYGSTSASAACIRVYYSTRDGAAFAYEGLHYWRNWAEHLGLPPDGLAKYREIGSVVTKTKGNGGLVAICENMTALGIRFEDWDAARFVAELPFMDPQRFDPPRRPDDPQFGESNGVLEGAVFFPDAGYVDDPQLAARNLQQAAEKNGGTFRFNSKIVAIRRSGGRVQGVTLADGTEIDAPIVVNVAGPHSSIVNRMAGVTDRAFSLYSDVVSSAYRLHEGLRAAGHRSRMLVGERRTGADPHRIRTLATHDCGGPS